MANSKTINELLRTIEIHKKHLDVLTVFDNSTKEYLKEKANNARDFLIATPRANSYTLKLLEDELFRYWNESITSETENFWTELRNYNIGIMRKEPLRFALTKKHFRTVEQGIDARNNWENLKTLKSIIESYSQVDIQQLESIIADDESNRYTVLKKCLLKNQIPQSQYLKFGECMAYFSRCRLFSANFSKEQVDKLHLIWKNFEAKGSIT